MLKVTYEIVEKEGQEPKIETTDIFINGALMASEVTEMLVQKNPEAFSLEVKSIEESGSKPSKQVQHSDDEPGEPGSSDEDDEFPRLKMEFTLRPDGCMINIESDGEPMVDGDIEYEDTQDPIEVGASLIASVQEVLDDLS